MSHPKPDPSAPTGLAARLRPLLASEPAVALLAAAEGVPTHLVGGAVRDILLGRPARDLDAVVERSGGAIAARLAERLGGRAIALGGDAFAAWRVARPGLVVDLWDRDGGPLVEDLARRDLTVDAIAVDLATGQVVDPGGGLEDLERRRLRAARDTAFLEDPLRVLRLARLGATLPGFARDPATAASARAAAPRLGAVARERVRAELELALAAPHAEVLLEGLVELGLHPGVWLGQPGARGSSASARRRFAALAEAERWLAAELPRLAPRIDRLALNGALMALEVPGGEPAGVLADLARRGWLSRHSVRAMGRLLPWTTLPAGVAERRWLLHRTSGLWPTGLLVAGSAGAARVEWQRAARELCQLAERHGPEIFDPPPLLDGHEVTRLTGVPPGPDLGRWIARLRRLQIEGALTDAPAARRWLAAQQPQPRTP